MGEREDRLIIGDKLDLCVKAYQQAYGKDWLGRDRIPDAAIVPDTTMTFLRVNGMLRNSGEPKLAYSGMAVATAYGNIGAYWLGRLENKIEVKARTGGKTAYHKAGGVHPFVLATAKWFPIWRGLQGIDRFKYELDCDIGVPLNQLERLLAQKVAEIQKRRQ